MNNVFDMDEARKRKEGKLEFLPALDTKKQDWLPRTAAYSIQHDVEAGTVTISFREEVIFGAGMSLILYYEK